MLIRSFKPSDLDAILQLFHEVVHSVGRKYYDQEQVNTWAPEGGPDPGRWLKSLSQNITYVAEVDGKIVGFGDMTHTGYIDHLYVHKNYQGQGIALKISRKLEEDARKLGLTEITTEASIVAKPIAEKQGYKVVKEQKKMLRGVEFINYLMVKKL